MPYGYNGKILRVDLTNHKIEIEEPDELIYRRYLGGAGLGAYYLMKELKSGVDPLGPDNIMVFASSVIVGTGASGANRVCICAKSPLTEGWGATEASGWWSPELKSAGFDAIIVKGKAENPVYLWVHDGEAEIRDASSLWGQGTMEAQNMIRDELGDKRIRVAGIGPGGENLVRYACVINETKHACGRTGMGAVMGSKNLKAIACRGKKRMELADPEKVKEIIREVRGNYKRTTGDIHDTGTDGGLLYLNDSGFLPTRNFQDGSFEHAKAITGETMKDTILVDRGNCYGCMIACKREVEVKEGPYAGKVTPLYGGPEYETVAAFGSNCGIGDLSAIAYANQLCGYHSLDTIGTGTTIAFAMECYENGLITIEDTDGIDLRFGNAEAMVQMVEKIANRDGFGGVLAEGCYRAAQKIGKGAEKYAMHAKKQEFPMHMPRGKQSLSIGYAVSPTGACHCEATHDDDLSVAGSGAFPGYQALGIAEPSEKTDMNATKVKNFFETEKYWSAMDSLCICMINVAYMGPWPISKQMEYTSAVTGWEFSLHEYMKVGERMQNLARLFNIREGFTAADDKLPERMFEPIREGALKGVALDRNKWQDAIKLYYQMSGWDQDGVPSDGKLVELDIDWAKKLAAPDKMSFPSLGMGEAR